MRANNVVVLVVAVVLGGIAAILTRNWLVSHGQASSEGTIVVAAKPIAFGTQLTADNLTEIAWTAADRPDGSYATKQDLLKDGRRTALAAIARKEPVLRTKITSPGQRATLSTTLDPGKRAVTVRVDDVRGVAGFIQPGDRVDVVLIRTEAETKNGEGYSDVILQSARVLAIDQVTSERSEQATVAKAVTLEVSAEEAQKILLATNVGRLSLILRQPDQVGAENLHRVTEADLSAARSAPVAARAPAPSNTRHVTVYSGIRVEGFDLPIGIASKE